MRVSTWAAIIGGSIYGLISVIDQVSMQRYFSAKSLREAQKAIWFKPCLAIPLMVLLYCLGLALYAHYQLHPQLAVGINKPDQAFPHFILNELPHGLSGVLIVAIFAAAMSSIDSGVHSLSTVTVEDYYRRVLRPKASDHECLLLARWLTLGWGCLVMVAALLFSRIGSIFEMMGTLGAPFFGCVLGIFLLGTMTRRASGWGAFFGGVCGYGLVLWVIFCLRRVDDVCWDAIPESSTLPA